MSNFQHDTDHGETIDTIEAELLAELEDLSKELPNSPSAWSFSCEVSEDDILVATDEECGTHLNAVNGHVDPHAILRTIPGYESFQESLDIGSSSHRDTKEAVSSIQTIIGGNEIISIGEKEGTPYLLMEEQPSNQNNAQTSTESTPNGKDDIFEDLYGNSSTGVDNLRISFKERNNHAQDVSFLEFFGVSEESNVNIEQLQKEVELEATEELKHREKQHKTILSKRAIEASKERDDCTTQNRLATNLQILYREYSRKKVSRMFRAIYKGYQILSVSLTHFKMKYAFCEWTKYMNQIRSTKRVQQIYRKFLDKKKKRQRLLSKALGNLRDTMKLRKTFFYWTIYTSSLRLQTQLMYQLKRNTITIQCAFRRYHATCLVMARREEHMSIIIQMIFRIHLAKKRYISLKEEKSKRLKIKATISIQKIYRGYRTRNRMEMVIKSDFAYIDTEIDDIIGRDGMSVLDDIYEIVDSDCTVTEWKPCKPAIKDDKSLQLNTNKTREEYEDYNTQFNISYNLKSENRKESMDDYKTPAIKSFTEDEILLDSKTEENLSLTRKEELNKITEHTKHISDVEGRSNLMEAWNFSDKKVEKVNIKRRLYNLGIVIHISVSHTFNNAHDECIRRC
jgi:hypothetical protein